MSRDDRIRDAENIESIGEQTYWEGKTYEMVEQLQHLDNVQLNILLDEIQTILDRRVDHYSKELPF